MKKTFRFSPLYQRTGFVLLGLMALLYAVLFLMPLTTEDRYFTTVFVIFTLPFTLIGFYLVARHTGQVVLTESEIVKESPFGRKAIPYNEVVEVRETDSHFPPNLTLKTTTDSLRFSREIEELPKLYKHLWRKMPALHTATHPPTPWSLQIQPGYFWDLFLGIGVSFFLLGSVTLYVAQNNEDIGGLIIFMIVVWGVSLFLILGAMQPEVQGVPLRVIFDSDRITIERLLSESKTWPVESIEAIQVETKVHTSPSLVLLTENIKTKTTPLVIILKNGERVVLKEAHVKAMGYTPERLLATLHKIYTPRGISVIF